MADIGVAGTKLVYEGIRAKIVSGVLRPNEALIEDDLAKAFLVSRTPVRESLQRLYRDGLIIPRKRGWQVKEFSRAEVKENYEVRAELEGLAARLAAVRGSLEHKANIQRIHQGRLNLSSASVEERVRSNREMHEAIVEAAQNERLRQMIDMTQNFFFSAKTASQATAARFEQAQVEHEEVVDAILKGDPDRAHDAMRTHVLNALSVWLDITGLQ